MHIHFLVSRCKYSYDRLLLVFECIECKRPAVPKTLLNSRRLIDVTLLPRCAAFFRDVCSARIRKPRGFDSVCGQQRRPAAADASDGAAGNKARCSSSSHLYLPSQPPISNKYPFTFSTVCFVSPVYHHQLTQTVSSLYVTSSSTYIS